MAKLTRTAPTLPPPTGRRCFRVEIPDDPSWIAAFQAGIGYLLSPTRYDTDRDSARQIASIFAQAVGECTIVPIDCDEVNACIEPTITTINNYITEIQQDIVNQGDTITNLQVDITNVTNTTNNNTSNITNLTQQFNSYITNNAYYSVAPAAPVTITSSQLDQLYGQSLALATSLAEKALDLLEFIDTGGNYAEGLAKIWEAIPLLESIPVDDALALKDFVIDQVKTVYMGQDSTAAQQVLACEIFCRAKDTLVIDAAVMDAALGELSSLDPMTDVNDLWQLMTVILTGGLPADEIYYGVQRIVLQGIMLGNRVLDWTGLKQLQFNALLGDPSDDWIVLCGCTPTVYRYLGQNPATGVTAQAAWNETAQLVTGTYGLEYLATLGTTNAALGPILQLSGIPEPITKVTVRCSWYATRLSAAGTRIEFAIRTPNGLTTYTSQTSTTATAVDHVYTFTLPTGQTAIRIDLFAGCATRGDAAYASIHSIELEP